MSVRYQENDTIRIQTEPLVNASGTPLTGLGDVLLLISRASDDFFLDWNDNTFKSSAWTDIDQVMTELDATNAAGVYYHDFPATGHGDDEFTAYIKSATAKNSPLLAAVNVGGFIDSITEVRLAELDAANLPTDIANVQSDTDDIQARLPAALVSGRIDASVGAVAAGAIDAAAIATDAVDADALAASAVNKIVDQVWTEAIADHDATVGSTAEALQAADATADPAAVADAVWDEPVSGHQTAGTYGRNATSIAQETTAAVGSTTTEIRTTLTEVDDFYNNMQVVVVNAAGTAVRNIDDYANTNGAITVSTLPFTPAVSDPVLVLRRTGSVPTDTGAIAAAVWDEAKAGHVGAGSFGEEVQSHSTSAEVATVQADTDDIQARLPAALVGGRMDSDVGAMQADTVTAAVIATDAIDADAIAANAFGSVELATTAVNEIRDAILSDATPFPGASITEARLAELDAANLPTDVAGVQADTDNIQTRLPAALVGGRMDSNVGSLDTDVITSISLATSAINEIRDGILSDSTPFAGANVDATISSRAAPGDLMGLSAGGVDAIFDETLSGHLSAGSVGLAIAITQGFRNAYVLDGGSGSVNTTKDAAGMITAGRIRIFSTPAAASSATLGAADGADGEIANINLTAAGATPGRLDNMTMID